MRITMNVSEELGKFILSELAVDHDKQSIEPDEDLITQGIVDSMGIIKLVTFMEEKFGITISDADMVPENFHNIESLTRFVEQSK
jgi:acyl carrier protein